MNVPEYGPADLARAIRLEFDENAPLASQVLLTLLDDKGDPLVVRLTTDAVRTICEFLDDAHAGFPGLFRLQ